MKKNNKTKIIIIVTAFLFTLFLGVNTNGVNVYEPLDKGADFETINERNNKGFYDQIVPSPRGASTINDYIISKKLKPATIKKQYYRLSNITAKYKKMSYNTANKKPKGVIVHATAGGANDNIDNEITYMNRNWMNAFVHGFTDYKEIVEIHDPNYSAWGAGPKANPYYIHIELVETGNRDRFINSVNNQAYYVASKLNQFGLAPSRAKKDKTGSVWFHSEVTKFLGGTDHSDPTGYFKKYGYTLAEFYSLVQYHYKEIKGDWKSTSATIQSHSNGQAKQKVTTTTLNGRVIERHYRNYNLQGRYTSQQFIKYHTNGKIKVKDTYTYLANKRKVTGKNYRIGTRNEGWTNTGAKNKNKRYGYTDNGKLKSTNLDTHYPNGRLKYRSNYYNTERKVKVNKKTIKLIYRSSTRFEGWASNGLKNKNMRYKYNRSGQLVTNKYGKAERFENIHKNGKVVQSKTRIYTKKGKLGKKVYYSKKAK